MRADSGATDAVSKRPAGLCVVAVVFFVGALVSLAQIIGSVFDVIGFEPANLRRINGVLAAYVLLLVLVLYGVFLLIRRPRIGRMLMFAVTIAMTIELVVTPMPASSFYSPSRMYFNRLLLDLPLIASCVYLSLPRFRTGRP